MYSIALQTDGRILAAGIFTTIGGQPRNNIARLNAATGLADSFNPNTNAYILSVAVQSDGKILAGGGFTTVSPNGGVAVTRNNIARLETDGRLDRTFDDLNLGSGFLWVGPLRSSQTVRFLSAAVPPPSWERRVTVLPD